MIMEQHLVHRAEQKQVRKVQIFDAVGKRSESLRVNLALEREVARGKVPQKRQSDVASTGTFGFHVPSGCLRTQSTSLQQLQQST
jgi:hypothetical protein